MSPLEHPLQGRQLRGVEGRAVAALLPLPAALRVVLLIVVRVWRREEHNNELTPSTLLFVGRISHLVSDKRRHNIPDIIQNCETAE